MSDPMLWQARAEVLRSDLGEEIALLDPLKNTYFTLNATGAVIWNALQTPASLAQVCQAVADEYDIDPAICAEDVKQVLADLRAMGLLMDAPAHAGAS